MKGFLKLFDVISTILIVIWEAVEILAVPALLAVIGALNGFPWEYYVISIGGYFLLFALIEIICSLVFKALEKKYTPVFRRIINKIIN